jgi:hypothetical protein
MAFTQPWCENGFIVIIIGFIVISQSQNKSGAEHAQYRSNLQTSLYDLRSKFSTDSQNVLRLYKNHIVSIVP